MLSLLKNRSAKLTRDLIETITTWFWRFSCIGCGTFEISDHAKRIRLLNQFSLLVILSDIATIGHYLRFGMHAQTYAIGVLISGLVLTIYLNHLRYHQLARYMFLACANFGLAFFSLTMGTETGVHLLYFVTPLIVYLLTPQSDRLTRVLWILIPVTGMFFVMTQRESLQGYLPMVQFPTDELRFQTMQATSWTYIYILAVAWNFDRITTARTKKLSLALERQSVAYGLVVHDAASYLANITNSLYLLRRGGMNASDQRTVSEVLDDQVVRLGELMNTLRQHLKVSPADVTDAAQESNLGAAFDEALDLLKIRGSKSDHGIYVISNTASATGVALAHGDLVQIIDNFMVNASTAIKRAGGEKPIIVIESERIQTQDTECIRIRITDNGPGLSNDNFETLFFSQDKNARNGQRQSMGLRLITKYIKLIGGKLSCISPADSHFARVSVDRKDWGIMPGTTITIDLPMNFAWIDSEKASNHRQAA